MNLSRRSFLRGAVVLAPAVILTPGLLMKVKPRAVMAGETGRWVNTTFIEQVNVNEQLLEAMRRARDWMADMAINPPLVVGYDIEGAMCAMALRLDNVIFQAYLP